jgi:pimeloyl-ACP methyl ester carboxylesterase
MDDRDGMDHLSEDPIALLRPHADFGHERREVLHLPINGAQCVSATLHLPGPRGQTSEVRGQTDRTEPQSHRTPAPETHDRSDGSDQQPFAVLLLPGWTGPRTGPAELLVFLARELTRSGHAVLRIDFHGRGDASGNFGDCDLDRMIREAGAGLDVLKARFPAATVVAGGICSGANVALGLASLRPAEVASVLAFSVLPFQPARAATFDRRRRWKNFKQYAAKALRPSTWLKLIRGDVNVGRVKENLTTTEKPREGERNLRDSARDIERELLAWKGRVLFIWGGGDGEAPPSRAHYEKLHAAGLGREARWQVIPGANHNFYAQAWREELARQVTAFVGG